MPMICCNTLKNIGESAGQLPKPHKWSDFAIATLSFGYGVAVTNLQLAHIYTALVGEGVSHPVTFLKRTQPAPSRQVDSENFRGHLRGTTSAPKLFFGALCAA